MLVIIGAGARERVVLDSVLRHDEAEVGGLPNDRYGAGEPSAADGHPSVGNANLAALPKHIADAFVVAIGKSGPRERRYNEARALGLVPFAVHRPSAVVARAIHVAGGA